MPLIQQKRPLRVVPRGHPPPMQNVPAPAMPPRGLPWSGNQSWGRWFGGGFSSPVAMAGARPAVHPAVAKALTDQQMIDQYSAMLGAKQKTAMDALLADAARKRQGELASLAGFGAALQGYSHDLWGQTDADYRQAAAAQQSAAQGLGGQVGSGVAGMRAQEAALAGQLGYTGGTALPTGEAATAQVASEGGAKTGETLAQVGTAWGGYGATRPEYIGFMTGQNQMQLAREGIEADKDIRSEFLKLGMDNPMNALDMWSKLKESKRQDASTALATQTLRQNMVIQKAKLKQDWFEARARATTAAQKAAVDARYKNAMITINQQGVAIDQQTANARTVSAGASATSAAASASRAATAAWKARHPAPPSPQGLERGTYSQKIGQTMTQVDALLADYPGIGSNKKKGALNNVFATLWPQIEPYISAADKARARTLLRKRIGTKVAYWQPKPPSGGLDWSSIPTG